MFFNTESGSILRLSSVDKVGAPYGDPAQYNIYLQDGQHFTIRDSFYDYATFVTEWKLT